MRTKFKVNYFWDISIYSVFKLPFTIDLTTISHNDKYGIFPWKWRKWWPWKYLKTWIKLSQGHGRQPRLFPKAKRGNKCAYKLRFKPLKYTAWPKESQLVSKMNILPYLLNLQKLFEMRISVFSVQLRTMWYRSANILTGSDRNIPLNTREYSTLIDYWPTLYICRLS